MPRQTLTPHAVLAAAAGLANREGFDAVTVSAVARLLGVKPASLYEHVQGRDALLSGIHTLALGELGSRISDAVAGRSGLSALRALADAHRAYSAEYPGEWAALQRPATSETAQSPEAARVASLILAVLRGYSVPPNDLVHAVRLAAATINGFLALTDAEAFSQRAESEEESWRATIDALDRALKTWPDKGTAS